MDKYTFNKTLCMVAYEKKDWKIAACMLN